MTTATKTATPAGAGTSSPSADALNDEEREACIAHPAYFADRVCVIYDPNQPHLGNFRFRLWPWQWQLMDVFVNNKRVIVLKARQLGVSWLLAAYAVWTFVMKPGSNILFISKRETEARKLLAKAVFIYKRLPPEFRAATSSKDTDSGVQFYSEVLNSSMSALPATADAGRSESATLVIPDEWAFQDEAAEMFGAYEPTVGIHGEIKGVSTANGASGFFYELYQAAKKGGSNGFLPVFIPWDARPERTAAWYEEAKAKYASIGQPELLAKEYPSSDLEAFFASADTFFPIEVIQYALHTVQSPLEVRAVGAYQGGLHIFRRPAFTHRYVIGADIAEGIDGGNYSTAAVLDCNTGEVVATIRAHIAPDLFGLVLDGLGREYNTALLAPERNNHGIATVNVLEKQLRYPKLYSPPSRSLSRKPAVANVRKDYGWRTTTASRPELLFGLRQTLADGGLTNYDARFAAELPHFRQDPESRAVHYSASPGEHDDLIFAYGIAAAVRPLASHNRSSVRSTGRLSR